MIETDMNGHDIWRGEAVVAVETERGLMVAGADFRCRLCGQWAQWEWAVEGEVAAVKEPCAHPDGITTVVELEVPSGKMIVTDDLRPVYDFEVNDYNTVLGQAQATWIMARQGCAYGAVRNSSPGLYRLAATGQYVIASSAYSDEDSDGLGLSDCVHHGMEQVARICTDLWAYSIADFGDWKAKGGDEATLSWSRSVVDVEPGTYRFTHHTGEREFDWDADEVVYAHVERIR